MNENNLIIIVKDLNNNLVKDAKVSLITEKLSGKTDEKGQIAFPLPRAKKINVEVELNGKINTTTYYPTGNSDQKLEINFASYEKFQESQQTSQSLLINNKIQPKDSLHPLSFLLIFLIIILGAWLFFKKYRKSK
ncbi:MAG: hypothetical protein PHP97_01595 [Candidatus Shapirobacteria bacterium]|nr:hypothetical protein [Candidatus Shapirobacteria bacterium]MDD4382953.1 hypothetical protein [Candidatus Shapirobacteria bacterium]